MAEATANAKGHPIQAGPLSLSMQSHLDKQQKMDNQGVNVRRWVVESTRVSPSADMNLPLD